MLKKNIIFEIIFSKGSNKFLLTAILLPKMSVEVMIIWIVFQVVEHTIKTFESIIEYIFFFELERSRKLFAKIYFNCWQIKNDSFSLQSAFG